MKSIEFRWNSKGFHWSSTMFTHFAMGHPLQNVMESIEIEWNPAGIPLRISLDFNEICTVYQRYPLQDVMTSIGFRWNPKGYPLGFHLISMIFTHFARGYPLLNVRESFEIQWHPKELPLGFHWISMKFTHLTSGTPCKMRWNPLDVDELLRVYPLQNVRKSFEIQWNPKGYHLGFHWISMEFVHFTSGTPCKMWWNPLDFNAILRGAP